MSFEKPWERPWPLDEIINNADNWSLAGDVAVLNSLKIFANHLLTKSTEINNALQSLTNNLDEASLGLNIAQNEFQSLRNSQFIESRVYEDDETLPEVEDQTKKKEESDSDRTEDLKIAAVKGLEVLDKYFDKVEVSISDSEDDDVPTYVFRSKDLYIDRPLPYLIGSDEWYQHLHVGLEDSLSESESEKASDKFSESNSESDLPIIQDRSQIKNTSDTSSELNFSHKDEIYKPKSEFFTSSDSDEPNYVPVQNPTSNKNFAEQLADKLGNIIKQEQVTESEINTRPIQQQPHYGDIFFDEPPPLTEGKSLFSGGSGLFDDDADDTENGNATHSTPKLQPSIQKLGKAKQGLFDDDLGGSDDDIFSSKKVDLQTDEKSIIFSDEPPALNTEKKPVSGVAVFAGLHPTFKPIQSSGLEEQTHSNESRNIQRSKTVDLFNDDKFYSSANQDILPDKNVDLFDDNLFTNLDKATKILNTGQSQKVDLFTSDGDEDNRTISDKTTKQNYEKNINKTVQEPVLKLFDDSSESSNHATLLQRKVNLFDDDEDLFTDDLFSTNSRPNFTSGLFDDLGSQSDDLFSQTSNKSAANLPRNIFEDLLATSDDMSSTIINNKSGLKKVEQTSVSDQLNDHENIFSHTTTEEINSFSAEDRSQEEIHSKSQLAKPTTSLFDSPFGSDELFLEPSFDTKEDDLLEDIPQTDDSGSIKDDVDFTFSLTKTSNLSKQAEIKGNGVDSLLTTTQSTKAEKSSIGVSHHLKLFDASPPPVDDWETKSDASDDNFAASDDLEDTMNSHPTSLFSDEPPALEIKPKPTSYKVQNLGEKFKEILEKEPTKSNPTSPGKLKFNLNINVGALMPGAVRPKREVQRSHSIEKTDCMNESVTDNTANISSATSGNQDKLFNEDGNYKKPSIINASDDKVEVLQSITKDRAKVPLNRRPSTRKGRKAALKNTSSDFKLEADENYDPINTITDSKKKFFLETVPVDNLCEDQPAKVNVLEKHHNASSENIQKSENREYVKVEESDLEYYLSRNIIVSSALNDELSSDSILPKAEQARDLKTKKHSKVFKDTSTDVLNVEAVSKDNIMEQKPKSSSAQFYNVDIVKNTAASTTELFNQNPKKMTAGLFDDEDDDDEDIFKSTKAAPKKLATQLKTSLFDDDDEDDGIFKSVSSTALKKAEPRVEKKISKTSTIKKLENTKSEDDPLSALLNDD